MHCVLMISSGPSNSSSRPPSPFNSYYRFTHACVSASIAVRYVQVDMLHGYDVGIEVMGSKVNNSARLRIMPTTADAH